VKQLENPLCVLESSFEYHILFFRFLNHYMLEIYKSTCIAHLDDESETRNQKFQPEI
jgi:hypothetical protein